MSAELKILWDYLDMTKEEPDIHKLPDLLKRYCPDLDKAIRKRTHDGRYEEPGRSRYYIHELMVISGFDDIRSPDEIYFGLGLQRKRPYKMNLFKHIVQNEHMHNLWLL